MNGLLNGLSAANSYLGSAHSNWEYEQAMRQIQAQSQARPIPFSPPQPSDDILLLLLED